MNKDTFRAALTIHAVLRRRTVAGAGIAALGTALALVGATAVEANGTQTVGAVPGGFKATSITWASPMVGWVLGTAPCGAATCSDVIGTTDGAKTWGLLGKVNAPIAQIGDPTRPGITEIRFATLQVGWAFGPGLFQTTNGGRSWTSM